MPTSRVDFYLVSDTSPEAPWLTACRIIEKAYLRGHRLFVLCDNQKDAEKLDELLWTYKEDSFVPHNLQGEGPHPSPPVQIGYEGEPRGFNDILLNLSKTIPAFTDRFRRIIEIVANEDDAKEISRGHYRTYRAKQYDLNTHAV